MKQPPEMDLSDVLFEYDSNLEHELMDNLKMAAEREAIVAKAAVKEKISTNTNSRENFQSKQVAIDNASQKGMQSMEFDAT